MSAGDLARPNLGLEEAVYQQLCSEVDTVVHNGALVNHAYSYEQLFEPNVLGTVEVSSLIPHLTGDCNSCIGESCSLRVCLARGAACMALTARRYLPTKGTGICLADRPSRNKAICC